MTRFRRLVLELGQGAADPETMRQAAAFARLLDAELHALFVEDETLLHASGLPFAREISAVSGEWRPLAPDRLEAELRAAAVRARGGLEAAAGALGVRRSFVVRRGDLALHVADICVASDIVVVSPPRRMGEETTHGSHRLRETARLSPASVLFLPVRTGRPRGVVAAVVTGSGDPSLALARGIAAQERESLLVLAPEGGGESGEANVRFFAGHSAGDIATALGDVRERLIVMTRADHAGPSDPATDPGAMLAVARGVPVLVVEPV
jgi:hypothetical protein